MIAETPQAVHSLLETLWAMGQDIVLQEYIARVQGARPPRDRRRRPRRRVDAPPGEGRRVPLEPAPRRPGRQRRAAERYRRAAIRAAKAMGLEVAGVDMLEGRDGPKILEINSSPGLEGIERASGVDVAVARSSSTPSATRELHRRISKKALEPAHPRRDPGRAHAARAHLPRPRVAAAPARSPRHDASARRVGGRRRRAHGRPAGDAQRHRRARRPRAMARRGAARRARPERARHRDHRRGRPDLHVRRRPERCSSTLAQRERHGRRDRSTWARSSPRCERADVPVIAAVQGDVYGGGCELLLLCDLVIVESHAELAFRHAKMGLSPAWGGAHAARGARRPDRGRAPALHRREDRRRRGAAASAW